jgi:hypothetical protein
MAARLDGEDQRLCRGLLFRPIDILGDLIAEHLAVLKPGAVVAVCRR